MSAPMTALLLSVLLGASPLGASEPTEPQTATYSITKVHRYDMQVVRIAGQGLTVDIEGHGRRRFQIPHDFTFDIDGETQTLRQLRPGQKLRAYVTRIETGELMLVQDEGSAEEGVVGETVDD